MLDNQCAKKIVWGRLMKVEHYTFYMKATLFFNHMRREALKIIVMAGKISGEETVVDREK